MDVSIMIEGQTGLGWPLWKRIAAAVEDLGFAGLYRSDHFTGPSPPDHDSIEPMVSLAYVASHTQRIRFGTLVSPVSFREPVMLARQAAAIDDLSGGRMVLGVGAGWQQREHDLFGYPLGDVRTRMDRLEEAMQVITSLLRSSGPVSFDGRFYTLRDAHLSPKRDPATRVCLGGNGIKRSIPLAGRLADVWNGGFAGFPEKMRALDDAARASGRDPSEIRRTVMTGALVGTDVEAKLAPWRGHPQLQDRTTDEALAVLREHGTVAGTPDDVRPQLERLAAAGVQEVMLQLIPIDDLDTLELLARAAL